MNASSTQRDPRNARVSVVLPVWNEAAVLETLQDELRRVLQSSVASYELVFVDDGSTDESPSLLNELAQGDRRIRVLHLSRNFGQQAAVQAGLSRASGDVVVVMDSDLQDAPSAIPLLLDHWQQGYDVVNAIRTSRKESPLKRLLTFAFYRMLNVVSETNIPNDAGNFGLIDRRVANQIRQLDDRDRYFPGLRSWVGFRQIGVPIERQARYDRHPKVSIFGLVRLAKTAIFSFSSLPLSLFYVITIATMFAGVGVSSFVLYHKLVTGLAIPGWASISLIGCFFGTLNALGIAVLGEYVVRIYQQVRSRPHFLIAEEINFEDGIERGQRAAQPCSLANATPDSREIRTG